MKKERIRLDKPSYVGMCILDLSKTLMYDFHYNYIRKKYTDCQLLFADTDSLFYHVKTEGDVYQDFFKDWSLFGNSDYPESSKFFSKENKKKVIGKFKYEAADKPILEFLGLKSKMYSYEKEDYEKVKLDIIIEDGKPKYKIVKPENEKFIKKYVHINNKTAKGVKKNVIKGKISHSDYRDVLFNNRMMHRQMKTIQSEHHQISSY